jgi:ABC-type polysaccharide/polyol phosphate transport system ATPase subunit/alpha-L-arabinofuranosidase
MNSISVKNLSKEYRVYFEKPALVKSILPFLVAQGRPQQFWALRDVSFDLERGDCIGIVGPNGSGKSTLLSILAGVTSPTSGSVAIDGKVSSLLSLGAGFQFELTGQENIYLNGIILGLSKGQIDSIYDRVVEYADLGKFINAKLSTYSSGMNMRLGFSIAAMVPFDVLLIDEILAVGDMEFQRKCFNTMKSFYEDEGKTIVFVSHDLGSIEALCGKVIWFEHGRIEEFDDVDRVLSKYKERYREKYAHMALRVSASAQRFIKEELKVARIEVDAEKTLRRIPATLFGANLDWVNDGSCLWDTAHNRINPYLVNFMLPYGLASFRYPGVLQPDYFHWHEAVGDNRTPQRIGYPGNPPAYPYFGPDEFADFCESMNAEPFISVNVGTGTAGEAARWLSHYSRRGVRVPCWELGHELCYDEYHPLGKDFPFTPEQYAERAAAFIRALKDADPGVKVGAIGCCDTGVFTRYRDPGWNRIVLERVGEKIDFLSIHNTSAPILNMTPSYETPDWDVAYIALMAAPRYVEENMERVKSDLRASGRPGMELVASQYGVLFDLVPGFFHGEHHVKGRHDTDENWRQNSTLGAALYEAMLLNIMIRDHDITYAHRYSLFHTLFSALFGVGVTGIVVHPQAHMFRLYSRLAGKLLVSSEVVSDSFSSDAVGIIPSQKGVPYLDVIAARDDTNSKLSVFVVNRNLFRAVEAELVLRGYEPVQVVVKSMQGPSFDSSNQFHEPWVVSVDEKTRAVAEIRDYATGRAFVSFPKHSLTVLSFSREEWF